MLFLIEGKHGPIAADEGIALAKQQLPALRGLSERNILKWAWGKDGGGQVLILDGENRALVDDLIAAVPAHDSQEWTITKLTDFLELLDAYVGTDLEAGTPAEDG